VKSAFVWTLIAVLAVMAVLGLLGFPFARRFWVRVRRLGYVYVGLIIVAAAVSIAFGAHI
jgi:hypothetical protein